MSHVSNHALDLQAIPNVGDGQQALIDFGHTFAGYEVWGGLLPVQRIFHEVLEAPDARTPSTATLTIVRTALFGAARAERFVDFASPSEVGPGLQEHRDRMWRLVETIRAAAVAQAREDEYAFALRWLVEHDPPVSAVGENGPSTISNEDVADAVTLTARLLAADQKTAQKINEAHMRDRLARALGHLTGAFIEVEGHVTIPEFRGVGPVDIVGRSVQGASPIAFIECKWSPDQSRGKIYEAAWDAVKLALALGDEANTAAFLVTGGSRTAWQSTETPDLFESTMIETRGLWERPLDPRGANGGTTVGADCEAGGYGNMFTHAPERLRVTAVAEAQISQSEMVMRASAVRGDGPMIPFAPEPEFPLPMSQHWLDSNVPIISDERFDRLLAWLRVKRWPNDVINDRVRSLRQP